MAGGGAAGLVQSATVLARASGRPRSRAGSVALPLLALAVVFRLLVVVAVLIVRLARRRREASLRTG